MAAPDTTNGTVRLYSKQGYDHTSRYRLVAEALSRLKFSSVVLDGEIMCFSPDGQHDFDRLWNRIHDHEAMLCAFDLLELNGEDLRTKPLLERKARLAKLLKRDVPGLQFVERASRPHQLSAADCGRLPLSSATLSSGSHPQSNYENAFHAKGVSSPPYVTLQLD